LATVKEYLEVAKEEGAIEEKEKRAVEEWLDSQG
jgi:hypothetical protein